MKPANILVTASGVKLLDFGLAKATQSPGVDGTNQTVAASGVTQAGTVVGTAAYMSPEQATGAHVDERLDIFSFGAVLYEMVSGRPAAYGRRLMMETSTVTAGL